MCHRYALSLMLFMFCELSFSDELQRQDQLVWDYAEFVEEFSARDWSRVKQFIAPGTKAGFGGEMGMEGLQQVFGRDDRCHRAMSRALELGCRKIGKGEGMRCVAPPYLGPDVVYLGARASFIYSADAKKWMAESLICGGD